MLSPIVLIPAMTNRAAPDFERMIGPVLHIELHTGCDRKGIHP
jgi:hypothetical protein